MYENQNPIEESINSCNEHYNGIVEIYNKFLILLKEKVDYDLLIKRLKENLSKIKISNPFSHGLSDGIKRIDRIISDLESGIQTVDEVKSYLENEIARIERIIS